MATPVIETFTAATALFSAAEHNLTMPASLTAGNLLIAVVSLYYGNSTLQTSPSAGWFTLNKEFVSGSASWGCTFYKIATGTDTLTLTLSAATTCVYSILQISGANLACAAVTPSAAPGTGTWSPTIILPAYRKDYLYFTVYYRGIDPGSDPTTPTGYTLVTGTRGTSGALYVASRTNATTNWKESPGTWGHSAAVTIATLAVYQAPVISGTILDTAGVPLSLPVSLLLADTNARLTWTVGAWTERPIYTSQANGVFIIPIVNPHLEYTVWVRSPNSQYADLFFSRVRVDLE